MESRGQAPGLSGISSIPKYNAGMASQAPGVIGGSSSQSVPAIGGSYKYSSGIGGQVGTLGAPSYNFSNIPKYSTSGIAGGIGSLNPNGGGGGNNDDQQFGGRNKY